MRFLDIFSWSQLQPDDQLQSFCLVECDNANSLFPVKKAKNENAASLKDAIMEKNTNLRDVPAHLLILRYAFNSV
jgi:hypothetical protein